MDVWAWLGHFISTWYGILTIILLSILLVILLYRVFFKRFFDILLSFLALIILSPVYLFLFISVRKKLGKPTVFVQKRPGKKNKIFNLHKYRTMTNEEDALGNLLPDEKRMTKFGRRLRSTSFDELPEIWDIFRGKMSIIGPRPQLVRDLVFMDEEIKERHKVRPGLTGLAQVMGRNNLSWEERFEYDLKYVKKLNIFLDIKIFFMTIFKVLKRSDVSTEGMDTSQDYGEYLLTQGLITKEFFDEKIEESKALLNGNQT